jgi:hypothetical protein
MCCACSGGDGDAGEQFEWYAGCENSADGATDSYGDGCDWYDYYPTECGYYDTDDFDSYDMCCACEAQSEFEEFVEIFDSSESEVNYEVLSDFEEDDWEHFVEDDVDPFDPSVDWTEIATHLDDYIE